MLMIYSHAKFHMSSPISPSSQMLSINFVWLPCCLTFYTPTNKKKSHILFKDHSEPYIKWH